MTISSQRRGSLLTFAAVAVTVFALLSMIGGLVTPSASALDDDMGAAEPTQDPFDLSQWESCGDNCIVPELVCPPGFVGPVGSQCQATGKDVFGPSFDDFEVIECPEGQYPAYNVELNDENANLPGPPIDSQFCSEPTAELLFGSGIACPDGYSLTDAFLLPPGDFPLEPTDEELAELEASFEEAGEAPIVVPAAMPTPEATPAPEAMPAPEATPLPALPDELDEVFYPTCTGEDGTVIGATVSGFWPPIPFDPTCADGSRLWATPTGLVCRPDSGGPDVTPGIAAFEPPVCGPDEILVGDGGFSFCQPAFLDAVPFCPVGYMAYAAGPDDADICTNDEELIREIVALPVFPPDCDEACQAVILTGMANEAATDAAAAAADASDDDDYPSSPYPSTPACPAFALLADGTCANIVGSAGMGGTVAPAPMPTSVPVVLPVAPAPAVSPIVTAPIVTQAASYYGFGKTMPAAMSHTADATADTKAKTATTLAHTGTTTNTLLYISLSLIAAGAVSMGSRRREALQER